MRPCGHVSLLLFLLFQLPFLSTLAVSVIEHTIQPGIDLPAFNDNSGLKAHVNYEVYRPVFGSVWVD